MLHRRTAVGFAGVLAIVTIGAAPGAAVAEADPTATLNGLVGDLLRAETAATLPAGNRPAQTRNPAVTAGATPKLALRWSLRQDREFAATVAGASLSGASTRTRIAKVRADGLRRTAEVIEDTAYTNADGSEGYSYTARHRVTFARDGIWKIADITALDPASELSDARLAAAAKTPTAQRRAAIAQRITQVKASIDLNRAALAAGDKTKLAGKRVAAGNAVARPGAPGKATAPAAGLTGKRLTNTVEPLGGEGPPYDYQAMVNYATYYARDNAVPYARDENDCTTFISWTLWNGRYAERGSEAWPDYLFNYDDYDTWYWRCDDCTPRHSYAWGGATNWNIFEYNYGGRVTFMGSLGDLLLSDVMQMEIDGYGEVDKPDHTMMVTDREPSGWPKLSYHTEDTRNKPLWDIIDDHDGPYWAART